MTQIFTNNIQRPIMRNARRINQCATIYKTQLGKLSSIVNIVNGALHICCQIAAIMANYC